MAKKTSKLKSLYDYLLTCKNQTEVYEFSTPNEAYEFGKKLRNIEVEEEGVPSEFQIKKIVVSISGLAVRVSLPKEEEPQTVACSSTSCGSNKDIE